MQQKMYKIRLQRHEKPKINFSDPQNTARLFNPAPNPDNPASNPDNPAVKT